MSRRAALFGSWLRVITTLIVVTNLALIGLALAFLAFAGRQTLFRVDAVTDAVSFVTDADLRWGRGELRVREGEPKLCPTGALEVPKGAVVEARRTVEGVAIDVTARSEDKPVTVVCRVGDERRAGFVTLWFEAPAIRPSGAARPLTGREFFAGLAQLAAPAPGAAAVPVAGASLRIGGGPDADSALVNTPMIRSGTLSSETASWPIPSSSVTVDRPLTPGEIVSFDQPTGPEPSAPRASPSFTGLLLLSGDSLRIVARTEARTAYVTSPNATNGKPAIVAPTMLARLQAQAEWGVFLFIGGLMLGILTALRSLVLEDEKPFAWASALRERAAHRRKPPGAAPAAVVALAAAGLCGAPPARAQALTDHPVFRIEGPSGVGQGFAILNPRGTPRCLVVTAAHVVKPGDDVTLVGEQPNSAARQAAALRVGARYLDVLAPGLVVLQPDSSAALGACAPMPRPARADRLYDSDRIGRLTYAEPSGERRTIPVLVDGAPGLAAPLLVRGLSNVQIERGISGSPFSIDGQLLAVADRVANGVAYLTRVDTADVSARYVAAPPSPKWPPFSLERLPKSYRDIVQAARDIRKEAAAVQTAAQQHAQLADDAAGRARSGQPGYGSAKFVQVDRIYEGKIAPDGAPDGWGVLRFISGTRIGEEQRGYFRRDGENTAISGAGVIRPAHPERYDNQSLQEMTFLKGNWTGPGVLTFSDGDQILARWVDGRLSSIGTFRRASDETMFELTYVNGNWTGPGVRWSKDGQPLCICVWRDGKVVKDETETILGAVK